MKWEKKSSIATPPSPLKGEFAQYDCSFHCSKVPFRGFRGQKPVIPRLTRDPLKKVETDNYPSLQGIAGQARNDIIAVKTFETALGVTSDDN